jgi:hypothetical protein
VAVNRDALLALSATELEAILNAMIETVIKAVLDVPVQRRSMTVTPRSSGGGDTSSGSGQ